MIKLMILNLTLFAVLTILFSVISNNFIGIAIFAMPSFPSIQIFSPLTPDKTQFLYNQIMFHLDNHSSGSIESISNETGKKIIQYFKYNPEHNTVTVSNATIYTHYDLQVPLISKHNKTIMQSVNRVFNVKHVINPDPRLSIPSSTYFGELNAKFLSTNGKKYDKLNIQIIIPHELHKYQSMMLEYPSINK